MQRTITIPFVVGSVEGAVVTLFCEAFVGVVTVKYVWIFLKLILSSTAWIHIPIIVS